MLCHRRHECRRCTHESRVAEGLAGRACSAASSAAAASPVFSACLPSCSSPDRARRACRGAQGRQALETFCKLAVSGATKQYAQPLDPPRASTPGRRAGHAKAESVVHVGAPLRGTACHCRRPRPPARARPRRGRGLAAARLREAEVGRAVALDRVRGRRLPQRVLQRIAVGDHRLHLRIRHAHQLLRAPAAPHWAAVTTA